MAVLKLPRMPDGAAIVDTKNGKPITALTRAWDAAMSQIEDNLNGILAAQAAADAAQADADAAMAAAIAAQADADAAMAAAVAAQATADDAKATADALDAALNVTAGKVLTVLNTMTLAAIDGSTLNIGTGGTLGTAAYTNASDYLPSGTSLAFLPLAGGTLTGPLIVNSTLNVSGHTTFEGVTSTGATGTGRIVYDLSPTLTAPNIIASGAGVKLAIITQSHASTPQGIDLSFSAAAPNNTAQYFLNVFDNSTTRFLLTSNGGIYNYQSNNVNLSDEGVKADITRYSEAELDALEVSFCRVNWGKWKYRDQTHDDWNHGCTAQGVEQAFALTAPELVDEAELGPLGEDGKPQKHKVIYETDLTHIGLAVLSRLCKRVEAMEGKMYAAGIT